ncbi:hypothetical protein EXIGLDRAFT_775215 [Exidia glandulosa HHB12029]|uniref:F-box domain-containing protein n=1 Tax=Exidia glandulosa HHB12029 TaxID=1314781 RepID=A0A165E0H3_EXIGL|nr:hypothetical protein EXIGLDRAFT_775215 [Exidia glandulosa HHB12029]
MYAQPDDLVVEMANLLAQDRRRLGPGAIETVFKVSQLTKGIRQRVLPIALRALVINIGAAERFLRLETLGLRVPTRVLLLAIPAGSPTDYTPALRHFDNLSSLAIVSLSRKDDAALPSSMPDWLMLLWELHCRATLERLSLAFHTLSDVALGSLNLDTFERLTHVRLALEAAIFETFPGFQLPRTVHTLSVSPQVLVSITTWNCGFRLPALAYFEVACSDIGSSSWPGDENWTFPNGSYPSPIPLSTAFERFFHAHPSITTLRMENFPILCEIVRSIVSLPSLRTVSLHPERWQMSGRVGNDDDAAHWFATEILPRLHALQVLHIGAHDFRDIDPRYKQKYERAGQAWDALISNFGLEYRALARGRCETSNHRGEGKSACPADPFLWTNDEFQAMTYIFPGERPQVCTSDPALIRRKADVPHFLGVKVRVALRRDS